jgi:diaminohydroxyphosphoribosylaminopyrimidine deaminase/5-amino-6-(5-phosphoribosylamino)uracil reductase
MVRSANHDLLILVGSGAPQKNIEALRDAGVEVRTLPEQGGHLSLPEVLKVLAERNILSVLVEGGSHLNGAFLRQDLADKVVLFYSETELGSGSLPFAEGIASPYLFQQSLHRTTRAVFGTDACLTGYLHDPWQTAPKGQS